MGLKYQELENALEDMIFSGEGVLANGRFLSERRISERFQVSRATVRKAIDILCKQGELVQIHGSGTFVKDILKTQPLDSITRCSQNYAEMGLCPHNIELERATIPASKRIAKCLQVAVGSPVLCIKKLFMADKMIFNESISYISAVNFPGIARIDFSATPMLEIFRSNYRAYAKKTDHAIEAVLPPRDVSAHLQIPPETPVMLFESVSSGIMDGRFIPFEYFKTYYRTDFIRFGYTQAHEAIDFTAEASETVR